MEDFLAFLLGFGALAVLLIAVSSMGYYIGKLRSGWIGAVTVTLVCAAVAISNVGDFLFVAPLLSVVLVPAAIGFAIGFTKRHRSNFVTY